MNITFYDYLLSYEIFLRNNSVNVLEKVNMSSTREDIEQVNRNLKQIKKKNKEVIKKKINTIYVGGKIELFDIIADSYTTKTQKIALVHFLVELCLKQKISLNRIFKRKNGNSKIWEKINGLMDYLLFLFEEAEFSNKQPDIKFTIL